VSPNGGNGWKPARSVCLFDRSIKPEQRITMNGGILELDPGATIAGNNTS